MIRTQKQYCLSTWFAKLKLVCSFVNVFAYVPIGGVAFVLFEIFHVKSLLVFVLRG